MGLTKDQKAANFAFYAESLFEDNLFQSIENIQHIPKFAQRQDSTNSQLRDLYVVANRLGLYDAADIIRNICKF